MKRLASDLGIIFKSVSKTNYFFIGITGLAFGVLFAWLLAINGATYNDREGAPIIKASCEVTDKRVSSQFVGSVLHLTHKVETSCGAFISNQDAYDAVQVGKAYDLTTTQGNWATEPQLISVTPSDFARAPMK
jgi:hypothetical protein